MFLQQDLSQILYHMPLYDFVTLFRYACAQKQECIQVNLTTPGGTGFLEYTRLFKVYSSVHTVTCILGNQATERIVFYIKNIFFYFIHLFIVIWYYLTF